MKKVLCCILIICFLSSCQTATHTSYTDDNGNFVIEYEDRTSISYDSLPALLDYNGKEISILDVSFYEDMSEEHYSYTLYTVIELDLSSLDEKEIHWLRESDLDVRVYLTHEKNEYDFDSLPNLGYLLLTDNNHLMVVHTSSFYEENRYSFAQAEARIVVSATQEETYEHVGRDGEISDLHKEVSASYTEIISDGIPSAEEIEQPLYNYVAKWLGEEAESINEFYTQIYS